MTRRDACEPDNPVHYDDDMTGAAQLARRTREWERVFADWQAVIHEAAVMRAKLESR